MPTEPLVWQVAAYFTKLLREDGDRLGYTCMCTFVMSPSIMFVRMYDSIVHVCMNV